MKKLLILLCLVPMLVLAAGVPAAATLEADPSSANVILLIVYVLVAIGFSFLCSVAEAVTLSVTPSFVAQLEKESPTAGSRWKGLKGNVDRPLAAILTLNTIAHTAGAMGAGVQANLVFGSKWASVSATVLTLLILFLSEIVPKTLGAVHWRSLATPTAVFLRILMILLCPLIWVSEKMTRIVSGGKEIHAFSREEFKALADIGAEEGKIAEDESRVLNNLFRFDSLVASDVMTPRTVMVSFSASATVKELLTEMEHSPFSRFPVYSASRDEMVGFVMKTDVLLAGAKSEDERTLEELMRPLEHVSATMVLGDLLEFMLDHRAHLALVVDQYGATVGLVTMEDVLETLLGSEILDEVDDVEDMQQLARKKWKERVEKLGLKTEEYSETDPNTDDG